MVSSLARLRLTELALAEGRPGDARQELSQAVEQLREAGMETWDADGFRELSERVARLERPWHTERAGGKGVGR